MMSRKEDNLLREITDYLKMNTEVFLPTNYVTSLKNQETDCHSKKQIKRGLSVEILYSDRRKEFTEFHRIRMSTSSRKKKVEKYYWIRIVKNKPTDVIQAALKKQYDIMQRLFPFLQNGSNDMTLACSKAIVLLPDFNALLTRECAGELFNRHLKKQIPQVTANKILEHCCNCGVWLRNFHLCFMDETVSEAELQQHRIRFAGKYGRQPDNKLNLLTYCHHDFSPRNIFVGKKSVEVIDFVGVEKGFPEEDIEFFRHYIMKAKFNGLYSHAFKSKMVANFIDGYHCEAF